MRHSGKHGECVIISRSRHRMELDNSCVSIVSKQRYSCVSIVWKQRYSCVVSVCRETLCLLPATLKSWPHCATEIWLLLLLLLLFFFYVDLHFDIFSQGWYFFSSEELAVSSEEFFSCYCPRSFGYFELVMLVPWCLEIIVPLNVCCKWTHSTDGLLLSTAASCWRFASICLHCTDCIDCGWDVLLVCCLWADWLTGWLLAMISAMLLTHSSVCWWLA